MKAVAILASVLLAGAVWGADPMIGTWKINIEKSKYDPGPPPKSGTAFHSEDGGFIVSKGEFAGANGQPSVANYRWKKDGKEYAITGLETLDAVTAKRVNDRTTDFTYKKGGKVVSNAHLVVSQDGKVATVTNKGPGADGKPFHNLVIWEKQ